MEKHLYSRIIKIATILFLSFFSNTILAQSVGEIIPYTIRDTITVRGDMTVTGNSILGVRGVIEGVSYEPNDPFDAQNNNGVLNSVTLRRDTRRNQNGDIIRIDERTDDNSLYTRAYIDIDSDPDFDNRFSAAFKANSINFEYGGTQNPDGAPTSPSTEGTFSSSGAELLINPTCGIVRRAFLYWSAAYPNETVNGFNNRLFEDRSRRRFERFNDGSSRFTQFFDQEVDPGGSNTPRSRFCGNNCEDYTEIKILPPNGDQYYNISFDTIVPSTNPGGLKLKSDVIVDGIDGSFFNNQSEINAENRLIAQREIELGRNLSAAEIQQIRDSIDVPELQNLPYVCVADVTELFNALQDSGEQVSGFWTVANVRATTGYRPFSGLTGGWSLAVAYEENVSTATERQISFFDGYTQIRQNQTPVSFSSPPFETIPEGPVNAWLATASLEGDRSLPRDQFLIETATTRARLGNGADANGLPDAAVPLRENSTPDNTTNFFNSTITDLAGTPNFRSPNSSNTLGYDTDHFSLNNTNNSILDNTGGPGQSGITDNEATFWLATDQDSYSNFFTGFAVEIIAPNVQVLKVAFDRFGNELTNNAVIEFGDELTYELVVRNIGNDVATNILLSDFLPVNTVIIPGTTRILLDNVEINPTIIPNQTSIDRNTLLPFTTTLIEIPIQNLTPQGECPANDASCRTQVTIRLESIGVLDECDASKNACIERIENVALTSFQGIINDRRVDQSDSFFRFIDGCDDVEQGPTVTLANRVGECESTEAIVCEQDTRLTAGTGFTSYRWFRIENPEDRNGNSIIDDADYARDLNNDGRITLDELEAEALAGNRTVEFIADTSNQVANGDDPGPNELDVDREDEGLYIVIEEAPNPCLQQLESFNVIDFFGENRDAFNLLTDNAGNIILGGTAVEPVCATRSDLDFFQFIICDDGSGANDSLDIPIPSTYLDNYTIEVFQYQENSCDREGPGCPFLVPQTLPNTNPLPDDCGYDRIINTTAGASSEISINQTGSYYYRVTLIPGGCEIVGYFNVILLNSDVNLIPLSAPLCNDTTTIELQGLPDTLMSPPNRANTPGLLYVLEFYENTEAVFDEANSTPVLVQNPLEENVNSNSFVANGDYGIYTLNRPAASGQQSVEIIVRATPIITGSVADTASPPIDCPPLLRQTITFLDVTIEDFRFSEDPICGTDNPSTSRNETLGDITVTVDNGNPSYFYQLINDDDNTEVATINNSPDENIIFRDVAPGINYKIRVFANGFDNSLAITDNIPANSRCIVEQGNISVEPVFNIVPTLTIVKGLTCEPAQLRVELSVPDDPNFDLSNTTFEINDQSGNLIVSGRGALTHFLIDDISNQPPVGGQNDPVDTSIIYAPLNSIQNFTINVISNPSCIATSTIPNSISPFNGIEARENTRTDVLCNGFSTGGFVIGAFEGSTNNPYVSPLANAGTQTEIVYEITNATPTDANIIIDPDLLDRQTSPVFTGLPAGNYTVRAIDITGVQTAPAAGNPCFEGEATRPDADTDMNGLTDCEELTGIDDSRTPVVAFPLISECPSIEIPIIITQPDPLLPVTISLVQPYTCGTPIQEAIIGVNNPTANFGGTPPYTFTLIDDNDTEDDENTAIDETADDRVVSTTTSDNYSDFQNITEGSYVVQITDANNCTSLFSEDIDIAPLPTVTFEPIVIPVLSCTSGTPQNMADIQVTANADNNADIEGYRIFSIDGVPVNPPAVFTANPSGLFENLTAGQEYVFETRTTNTLCTEVTGPIEIEPVIPVNLTLSGAPTNVLCNGEDSGAVSYTVTFSNVGATTGYTYQLTLPSEVNPVQEITTPITNSTLDLSMLSASTEIYTITVTDASTGCTDTDTFRITEPATRATVVATEPVYNCETDQYTFTITPSGGTSATYEYSLDNFATAPVTDPNFAITAPTVVTTLSIAVRQNPNCIGTPVAVTLNPVTDFTATENTNTDVCLPGTPSIIFNVTGTPPFRYRFKLRDEVNFPATFESGITSTPGQITVQNPPTTSGVYDFEIQDSLHQDQACSVVLPITINDEITTTTPTRATTLDCQPSGNVPATGEFIAFDVLGGNGAFTYTLTNITTPSNTPPSNADNVGTVTSPRFDFDSSFDDQIIEITITDGNGCVLPNSIRFTPNYPEAPTEPAVSATTILCNGDDSVVTVVPTELQGVNLVELPGEINNFEYSFDNGATFGAAGANSDVVNLGTNATLTVQVVIRNAITKCISPTVEEIINQPIAITETGPRTQTNVICDPNNGNTTAGSFQTTISGGTVPGSETPPQRVDYLYQLFNDNAPTVEVDSDNNTTGAIDFQDLQAGNYSIIVTDGNGCTNPTPIRFSIIPEPEIAIVDIDSEIDCTNGVTLFFAVEGGVNPDLFRLSAFSSQTPVDPSVPGDDFARLGDPDFLILPPGVVLNTSFTTDRIFRATQLDFDTNLQLTVVDDNSTCESTLIFQTPPAGPPSPVTVTSAMATNAGSCNPNSGAVDVTFDVDPSSQGATFEVDIFRRFDNVELVPTVTVTNALATNVVPTIRNLPEGQLRVRVIQTTGAGVCSNTLEFEIGRAPELEGPLEVNNIPASCDDPSTTSLNEGLANFTVRASGGQGPFEYRIESVDPSNAAPSELSSFPLSNTFSIDPTDAVITPGIVAPNIIGQVEVWVRDFNGCISGPLLLDVRQNLVPELTLEEFSTDECNDVNSFNITATINNFDANQTYTFTVNGGPAQALDLTATSNPNEATGTITVTDRIGYTIEVAGSLVARCTTEDTFRIFPRLAVDVALSEPDCNGEIQTITATVTNGFAGEAARQLTYELLDGSTSISTITGSTNTTETFTSGIDGVNLVAGTTYTITVTDDFNGLGSRTCEASNTDSQTAIQLPAFGTPTIVNLTCPTDPTGSITINIDTAVTSDTPPLDFELYEFPDLTTANTAINAGTVRTSGTAVISATANNVFTNLQGESNAVYVPILIATTLNCPIPGTPIALTEPTQLVDTNFNVTVTRQGICNDADTTNDTAIIRIEPLMPFANGADSDYVYSIAGVVTDAPLTAAVDQEITPNAGTNRVVNIEIRDRFTTCNVITITRTLDPCPIPIDPLTVNVVETNIDCFGETDGSVTFTVAPANGNNPPTYTYRLVGGNPAITPRESDPAGISDLSVTELNLTPGNYTLTVIDLDEPSSAPETRSFTIEIPNTAPNFNPSSAPDSCTTVTVNANVVSGSGTPGNPENYTFELDDPSNGVGVDVTNATGIFPGLAAPTSGTISYSIRILDDNNCPVTKTIEVGPIEQIATTLTTPNICLPNASTPANTEVRIDITSGTPPFRFARVNAGAPAPAPTSFTTLDLNETRIRDTSITIEGDYEYYIEDANGCDIIEAVTINPVLELTGAPTLVPPVCVLPNAMPQARSNGTYNFTPIGGTGTYTFEVAQGTSEATLGNFAAYTAGFPFQVTNVDDGTFFQFRISDGQCSLTLDPFSFDFPEAPTATAANAEYFCANETATVEVIASGGLAPYTYEYRDATSNPTDPSIGSGSSFTGTAGTYNYIVRDAKNCEFMGSFTIDDSSVNISGDPIITDLTCNVNGSIGTTNGAISINVIGGSSGYDVNLIDSSGAITTVSNATAAPFTATFNNLDAGIYRIEITDSNNCDAVVVPNIEVESISPIDLGEPTFLDCSQTANNGATLIFAVTGNTGDPINIKSFELSAGIADVFVDPSASTADDVSRFGDADFPMSEFDFPAGTPMATTQTFYAILGLDFNTDYLVEVIDNEPINGTQCPASRTYTIPPSDLLEITTITTTPEAFCNTGDGQAVVNFQRGTSTAVNFDAVLIDPDNNDAIIPGSLITPVTTDASGAGTVTFTALAVDNYRVRITEAGTLCGNSEVFSITKAPALNAPTVNSSLIVNCNTPDAANFSINVSATGGIPFAAPASPYNFAVVDGTDIINPPLIINSPSPIVFDSTVGTGEFVLWVMDSSNCPAVPVAFEVIREPLPVLTVDPIFSEDQCDGVSLFRFDVQLTNYDPAFEPYTFTVDGQSQSLTNPVFPTTFPGILTGQLIVNSPGDFVFAVQNSDACSSVPTTATVFEPLEIVASLDSVADCDGNIPSITGNITGGFVTGPRTLTYELLDNAGLVLNTISNNTTTVTFTTPQLVAGENYRIRVTDDYGIVAGDPSCSETSVPVSQPVLNKSDLDAPTVVQPTCNGDTGSVRINTNNAQVGDTPIVFGLYSFGNRTDAENAVTNDDISAGTAVRTPDANQDYTGLAAGFYVDVVFNGSLACPTVNSVIEIVEPPVFVIDDITADFVQPTCNPVQAAQVSITVNNTNSGTRPYLFRLLPTDAFTEIAGTDVAITTPITITVDAIAGTTYDIQFRDSGSLTCLMPIPSRSVTVPELQNPFAATATTTDYSCVSNEMVSVQLTNLIAANNYTLTVTTQPTASTPVIPTPTFTGADTGSIDVELDVVGRYVFTITDGTTGCDVEVTHDVDDVEQLMVTRLPVSELTCTGDTTMIGFEVPDFTGFYRYTITENLATPVVREEAIVEVTATTATLTHTPGGGSGATVALANGTSTITSGVALGVNTYTIEVEAVSDVNGTTPINPTRALCMASTVISVNGPTVPVSLVPLTATALTCDTDAIITAFASGGTPPYTYTLTGPGIAAPVVNTTGIFEGIANGITVATTYTVGVQDSEGCPVATATPVTETITINPTEQLPAFVLIPAPVACVGDESTLTVTVSGAETVSDTQRINSRRFSLVEVDNMVGDNPSNPLATLSQSPTVEFTNIVPGINGSPRFFRVQIIDSFGCTTMSDVRSIEAPIGLTASNAQTIAIDCDTNRLEQGGLETAQFEISISGGTGPYNFTRAASTFAGGATPTLVTGGEVGSPTFTNGTPNTGSQLYELRPGRHFFRIIDANGCEAFTQVEVGAAPAPIEFDIDFSEDLLCPGVFGFVAVDGPVRGGTPGLVFELWVVDGSTETQIIDGDLPRAPIASVNHEVNSRLFTGLPDVRLPGSGFSRNARYEYRVSSGLCEPGREMFDITQAPLLEFNAISSAVSCEREEDATITVNLTGGLQTGDYTILLLREEGIDRSDANFADGATTVTVPLPTNDPAPVNSIQGTVNESAGIAQRIQVGSGSTNTVIFEDLAEGDYSFIISTPTSCITSESFITVAKKEPFTAVFDPLGSSAPDCSTDAPGTRTYTLEGGTPPYYYVVVNLDNLEEQPNVEDVFGIASNRVDLVAPNTFVDITIAGPSAGETFENNVNYQIFFVDSGNGIIAPANSTADVIAQDGFNACETETAAFNFEVPDLTGFTAEQRYICETGLYDITVIQPATSTLVRGNITYTITNTTTGSITTSTGDNVLESIEPGDIVITFDYERPDNGSVCSSLPTDNITQTLDDLASLEFLRQAVLDENGDPVLDAVGNEVRTGESFELIGLNRYRISAQGGLPPYTYQVTNTQGESLEVEIDLRGRAIFTITESGIYNFSVRDANDCTATSTANDIGFIDIEIPNVFNPSSSNPEVNRWFPDNLTVGDVFPIPNGGIVVEDGVTIITITTGGVTTGGVFTPGQGGRGTITGGTTTQGITVVTTINPDGETSSTVTVTTGGTLVGGITSGFPSFDANGNTTIVDGTTTGGTPSGGVTSAPVETGITATPTSTTVIRTTVGNTSTTSTGETTGGVFIETTTMPGPNNTTVTTARIIDLTTGTVTDGTRTGSIVIGGTISGGVPIATNIPVVTTTSGGTTINRGDDFINFENIEVMVFDRYGRLLEQFKGILNDNDGEGWDGTYQGNPMPTGDYWYLIKLNDERGREISGNFTLYRSK